MTRPLFRDEATLALRGRLSHGLEHPALKRSSGVLLLLATTIGVVAGLGFVPVSLGVTAPGVLRLAQGSTPILAERSGVLTYVISERQQDFVEAGTVLASIRNLDLAVSRNAPNSEFSLAELKAQRQRIDDRLAALVANRKEQDARFAHMRTALDELLGGIDELVEVYQADIERLTRDLAVKEEALGRGNLLASEVEAVRNLLQDRQIQLRESHIRQAEIQRQLAALELESHGLADAAEQEALQLANLRSEIDMSIQTESEIAPLTMAMPADGLLVPRGFEAGQAVAAGDVLFDMVSEEDAYLFEVDVSAAQIGELREGLPVRIALTAYPYFEYGFLDGTLKQVTRAPNEPIDFSRNLPQNSQFRVIVEPDPASFAAFRENKTIMPGMSATVHIRREKVALWRLVLAPLLRFQARV